MYGTNVLCGVLSYLKSYLVPLTTSTVNHLNGKTQLIVRLTREGSEVTGRDRSTRLAPTVWLAIIIYSYLNVIYFLSMYRVFRNSCRIILDIVPGLKTNKSRPNIICDIVGIELIKYLHLFVKRFIKVLENIYHLPKVF